MANIQPLIEALKKGTVKKRLEALFFNFAMSGTGFKSSLTNYQARFGGRGRGKGAQVR